MKTRFNLQFGKLFDKSVTDFYEFSNYVFFSHGKMIAVSNYAVVCVPMSKLFWSSSEEMKRIEPLLEKKCIRAKSLDKLIKSKADIDLIIKKISDDENEPQCLHFIDTKTKETFKIEPYTITSEGDERTDYHITNNIVDAPPFNTIIEDFDKSYSSIIIDPNRQVVADTTYVINSVKLLTGLARMISHEEERLNNITLAGCAKQLNGEGTNLKYLISNSWHEIVLEIYCANRTPDY